MSVLQVCFKDKSNPECIEADSGSKSNQDGWKKKKKKEKKRKKKKKKYN